MVPRSQAGSIPERHCTKHCHNTAEAENREGIAPDLRVRDEVQCEAEGDRSDGADAEDRAEA